MAVEPGYAHKRILPPARRREVEYLFGSLVLPFSLVDSMSRSSILPIYSFLA